MQQFGLGNYYTAEEIAATVGGDARTAFPLVAGATVAMRLRPDVHRDAPHLVHVDVGPVPLRGLEHLTVGGDAIPVFLKDPRRTLYAYLGEFIVTELDRDAERCRSEGERIGRRVVALAHLARAG